MYVHEISFACTTYPPSSHNLSHIETCKIMISFEPILTHAIESNYHIQIWIKPLLPFFEHSCNCSRNTYKAAKVALAVSIWSSIRFVDAIHTIAGQPQYANSPFLAIKEQLYDHVFLKVLHIKEARETTISQVLKNLAMTSGSFNARMGPFDLVIAAKISIFRKREHGSNDHSLSFPLLLSPRLIWPPVVAPYLRSELFCSNSLPTITILSSSVFDAIVGPGIFKTTSCCWYEALNIYYNRFRSSSRFSLLYGLSSLKIVTDSSKLRTIIQPGILWGNQGHQITWRLMEVLPYLRRAAATRMVMILLHSDIKTFTSRVPMDFKDDMHDANDVKSLDDNFYNVEIEDPPMDYYNNHNDEVDDYFNDVDDSNQTKSLLPEGIYAIE
ncbi:hypothetical protein VNO77_04343 [Canavalia gladiata]|uniref:Uncharacterized protein n=1 Tax=Canavalia gladiata TaxID=3824 RepID=A0AAN9MWC6_CANGL